MQILSLNSLAARWRAALIGASMAALTAVSLVACGGGGEAPGTAGTATAQSFASGPITGLGSIIVNGIRYDDSQARVERDDDGSNQSAAALKLGMMVEVQSSRPDAAS